MSNAHINYEGIEEYDLGKFVENAYLNYALYVIKDRAFPFIGDGLKPVQRRIVYTMEIEGINSKDKKKKSAYTVGQVLGRFHPHGDSACYEAMVIMAQNFSLRYPLIAGQGNFGEMFNPKGFAAMRYTESYLNNYSRALLTELRSGNVEWQPNYNNDEKEPVYLPARIPNILLNGTTGIAVAISTDIPPHNANEIIEACCALIDNPDMSLSDILQIVKGPDYPTKAEITNSPVEIYEMYDKGTGSIRQRAVWHKEKDQIVISQLPYQSAPNIIEQIAALIEAKKIQTIEDVRDESSETETRLILQLKSSKVDEVQLMNQLFVTTNLETTLKVNMNMIGLDGKPATKGLKQILLEWLEFRRDIVRKRFIYRLEKLEAELNRVQGFLIAFNNLDEVINIVRNDPKPREALMERFNFNLEQATAILDLRIRNLAKLEEQALREQEKNLLKEQKTINILLKSKAKFDQQVKRELENAKQEFTSTRNSPIIYRPAASKEDIKEEIIEEPVTVVLSKHGWIRCGKGHEFDMDKLQWRNTDQYFMHVLGNTSKPIYVIDSKGRSYSLMPNQLPNMRGYGEPITKYIQPEDGAKIIGIYGGEANQYILMATNRSYGFITQLKDLESKLKRGRQVINFKDDNDEILTPILFPIEFDPTKNDTLTNKLQLTMISKEGRVLSFGANLLPIRTKGTGNKLMDINKDKFNSGDDFVQFMFLTTHGSSFTISTGSRKTNVDATKLESTRSVTGNKGQNLVKGITSKSEIIVKHPNDFKLD